MTTFKRLWKRSMLKIEKGANKMRSKGFAVIIGGGQGGGNPFRVSPNKVTGPKNIKDIEKRFLERFNRLADKNFSSIPFDEDMWDYLHVLQKEILDLDLGLGTGIGFIEWNDPAQAKDYCESVHEKLTKCEKQLGLTRSNYQVY